MILQLNPPLPVITPKGKALAHFLIDEGIEHNLKWVCFQDFTGECWTFSNPNVRVQKNITHGRENISPFYESEDEELEDDEDEEFREKQYKSLYEENQKIIEEFEEDIKDYKLELKQNENRFNATGNLIKELLENDQIFPYSRQAVENFLLKYGYVIPGTLK